MNKKIKILIAGLFIVILALCFIGYKYWSASEMVQIKIKDNTLFYKGGTEERGFNAFKKALEKNPNITTLEIYSKGGDTIYGMKMGTLVFEKNLDVVVDTFCFSSCANYLFLAGKNKIMKENAIVAFHGNMHQEIVISNINGQSYKESLEENLKQNNPHFSFSEAQINEIIKQGIEGMGKEREFYKKINTSILTPLGGMVELNSQNKKNPKYRGFTYSLEDFKKFRVKNISYLGKNYPVSDISKNKFSAEIFTQKYEDIDFSLINLESTN